MNVLPILVQILSWLSPAHPHAELARAIAEASESPEEAVLALVWAEHESAFGEALSGRRWDSRAFGVMQVRDRPDTEHDVAASVGAWMSIRRASAVRCGDDGLAALSSGRCDRATRLAAARRAEAMYWLGVARITMRLE